LQWLRENKRGGVLPSPYQFLFFLPTNLFGERIIDYKKSQGLWGFQGIMNPTVYKNRQEKDKKTNKIDEILKEVKEDLKF